MNSQHLSDEAVAAFADGVLRGHARDRASRHTAECPECGRAVQVQREAVLALRAAPAPALPIGLMARLRDVPLTTPIAVVPTTVAADGSAMFATFGSMHTAGTMNAAGSINTVGSIHAAALVPPRREPRHRRSGPLALTAVALVAAGVLAGASATQAGASGHQLQAPENAVPAQVAPASFRHP